ncbi:hypothetical protein KAU11_04540 [Candidatus Babeliales bacterium]|nr:hypothetical protein [Candidatus Babeliales bacterium]
MNIFKRLINIFGALILSASLAATTIINEDEKWLFIEQMVPSNRTANLVDNLLSAAGGITGYFTGYYAGKLIACKSTKSKITDSDGPLIWNTLWEAITYIKRQPGNPDENFFRKDSAAYKFGQAWKKDGQKGILSVQLSQTLSSLAGAPFGMWGTRYLVKFYRSWQDVKIARKILKFTPTELSEQFPAEICKIISEYRGIGEQLPMTDGAEMIKRIKSAVKRHVVWTRNILKKIMPIGKTQNINLETKTKLANIQITQSKNPPAKNPRITQA